MSNEVRLVLDIATNRIVYYTSNLDEPLELNNYVNVYDYSYDLPENLNLNNCWNYALVGQKLQYRVDNPVKTPQQIFQANKNNFVRTVNNRIKEVRANTMNTTELVDEKFAELGSDSRPLLEATANAKNTTLEKVIEDVRSKKEKNRRILKNTEYLREMYINRASLCNNNEQLMYVRDFFMNRDLTQLKGKFDKPTIENIPHTADVQGMLDFVLANQEDFKFDTSRQTNLKEQKDTEAISLADLVPPPDIKAWHSDTTTRTEFFDKYKIITDWLLDFAEKNDAELGKAAIVKLKAGGMVLNHEDYGFYYYERDRFHLVLSGSYMYVVEEDTWITTTPGQLFWFNNKLEHYAYSLQEDRISVIFDIKPRNQENLKSNFGREKVLANLNKDADYLKLMSSKLNPS